MTTAFPGYKPTPEREEEEDVDTTSYHVPSAYKQNYDKVIQKPKKLPPPKLEAAKLSMPIIENKKPVMPVYKPPQVIPAKP